MGGLHSHGNTNVSKISILIGVFFCTLALIGWNSMKTIKEIEANTDASSKIIDELIRTI